MIASYNNNCNKHMQLMLRKDRHFRAFRVHETMHFAIAQVTVTPLGVATLRMYIVFTLVYIAYSVCMHKFRLHTASYLNLHGIIK